MHIIYCSVLEEDSLYSGQARDFQKTWKQLDIYYCTCSNNNATCGFTQGGSQPPCIEADNDPTDDLLESCRVQSRQSIDKQNSPAHYFNDDVEDEVGDFPFRGSSPLEPVQSYFDTLVISYYCHNVFVKFVK